MKISWCEEKGEPAEKERRKVEKNTVQHGKTMDREAEKKGSRAAETEKKHL